jgi:hypothetical protein
MADFMTMDLSTSKGAALAKKANGGHRLQRDAFPSTPEGWMKFCEYQIGLHTRAKGRAERSLKYWTECKKGEHVAQALVKANAATELAAELSKANAEMAELKKQLAALQNKK